MTTFTLIPYAESDLAVMCNNRKFLTKDLILAAANEHVSRVPNTALHHTHTPHMEDPQP